VTFSSLNKALVHDGWQVHSTTLSQTFDFSAYLQHYGQRVIPLFAITPKGKLEIFTVEQPLNPQPSWTIIGLATTPDSPGG
jgi:CPA1 family monovalent cation:H+ antiporter